MDDVRADHNQKWKKRNTLAEMEQGAGSLNKKFDHGVSLLSWAYNEEQLIGDFLKKAEDLLERTVHDYEIILVDDHSTDRTNQIASEFAQKNPAIKIFRNERNMNIGYSSRRAILMATKKYLFWQTVDWSYDISDLRKNLEYLREYDIVQGVRRAPVNIKTPGARAISTFFQLFGVKHLTRRSDTVSKAIISIINYMLIRVLFQVPVSDYQNVTIYSTEWIQSIEPEGKSSFNNPEYIIKSFWNGKSIKEVPISFIPRELGKGNGTRPKAIMAAVYDILRLWVKWIVLGKVKRTANGKVDRQKI